MSTKISSNNDYISKYGSNSGTSQSYGSYNAGSGFTYGYDPFGEVKKEIPTLNSAPSVFNSGLVSAPKSTATSNSSGCSTELLGMFASLLTTVIEKSDKKDKTDNTDEADEAAEAATTDKTDADSEEKTAEKEKELDGVVEDGITYYTASGLNKRVDDTAGKTTTYIGGSNNTLNFKGDNDENNFIVGGKDNNIRIDDMGTDDMVYLEGDSEDWEAGELKQVESHRAGKNAFWTEQTYKNRMTGSTVLVTSKQQKGWDNCAIMVNSKVRFKEDF